jgi:hypothetical protein
MNIFDECRLYTFDTHFIDLFGNCAKGIFPKDIVYDKKSATLTNVSTKASIVVPKNATEAMELLVNFFGKGGDTNHNHIHKDMIQSTHDNRKQSYLSDDDNDDARTESFVCGEWKKFKKEQQRRMLAEYVIFIRDQYNLNYDEMKNFECRLMLVYQFHKFHHEEVMIEDGKITNISTITFDPLSRNFSYPVIKKNDDGHASSLKNISSRLVDCINSFIKSQLTRPIHKMEKDRE